MEVLIVAYIADMLIGDPPWFPHPVRMMGILIEHLEDIARGLFRGRVGLIVGGGLIVLLTVAVVYAVFLFIERALLPLQKHYLFGGLDLYVLTAGIIGSFSLAQRGLISEVQGVVRELEKEHLGMAARKLSYIVGRDTKYLNRDGVIRALLETLSENASDGIVAPMFYFAIGGLPLAFAYKAINTLDSMLGYRSERYLYLGRVAARVDDIANYIPARLTALALLCSAAVLAPFYGRLSPARALRIILRDARKHPSPNAGFPEATVAGALGLVLLGPAIYDGVVHEKPFIGEGEREPDLGDVRITVMMISLASLLILLLFVGIHGLL